MLQYKIIGLGLGLLLSALMTGTALAAPPPTPGQPGAPNVACGSGNATSQPPGFSSGGFAHAGTVYAGSPGTPSAQNAQSSHAIAQYDVACFQQTTNH
jgi:hypothetical protein